MNEVDMSYTNRPWCHKNHFLVLCENMREFFKWCDTFYGLDKKVIRGRLEIGNNVFYPLTPHMDINRIRGMNYDGYILYGDPQFDSEDELIIRSKVRLCNSN